MHMPRAYNMRALALRTANIKQEQHGTRKRKCYAREEFYQVITANSAFQRLKLLWSYAHGSSCDIGIPTLKTGNISSFQTRDRVKTVTVNGPFACREGKCNGKRCSAFETKTRCETFVTRWTLISSSSSHGGYKTAATHRCPRCISCQQTHARQTANS